MTTKLKTIADDLIEPSVGPRQDVSIVKTQDVSAELDAEIAELEAQAIIREKRARIEALKAAAAAPTPAAVVAPVAPVAPVVPVKRGPGRPRKVTSETSAAPAPVPETSKWGQMLAPAVKKQLTIFELIELALTRESLQPVQLAKTIGETLERTQDALRSLRAEHRIFNVGMGDDPKWTWKVGNNTDTPTLRNAIARLISERAMTARDITNATGSTMSRVGGVLVDIGRMPGVVLKDVSEGTRTKCYLLVSDKSKVINYPAKRRPSVKHP